MNVTILFKTFIYANSVTQDIQILFSFTYSSGSLTL